MGESISVDMWAIPGIWIKLQIRRQGLQDLGLGTGGGGLGTVKCISKDDIPPGFGTGEAEYTKRGKIPLERSLASGL